MVGFDGVIGIIYLQDSLELPQEPDVIFRIKSEIINPIPELCNAFNTHAKGETGMNLRIDIAISQNVWMHHAGTGNFYPTAILTNRATVTMADQTGNINLRARFGKWKKRRTKTNVNILAIHFFCKMIQGLLKVCKPNILIDV